MEPFSHFQIPILFYMILLATLTSSVIGNHTHVGFYATTCPTADGIVQSVVRSAVRSNPAIASGLLQMFFHDCFVNGCDASILLDGSSSERTAGPNSRLRGFDVINHVKLHLENVCPGVVSCADILALAACHSVVEIGGIDWEMPTGRRDGLVSRASDVTNLPRFDDSIDVQIRKFAEKGLNTQDLVVLVGAHTIGTASCSLFSYRLYNFNDTNGPDPSIDKTFLPHLRSMCPDGGDGSRRVALDTGSVNRFDSSYFAKVRRGRGILESDSMLWADRRTRMFVQRILHSRKPSGLSFKLSFARSMVKMGNIGVKTGNHGEIRRVCNKIN